jgi:hypothetical protein
LPLALIDGFAARLLMTGLLRPLVDQDLAVVFYDMTTIRTAGLSQQEDDVRKFGISKEGVVARQVMLGVVQTAEGLLLYHEVIDGNTAEVTTLKAVIQKIVKKFPVKRVIAVADRGLLSTDNLADLQTITLPGGGVLEFILAVPGRRYGDFVELLEPLHAQLCANAKEEVLGETIWNKLRLIVAHDPVVAKESTAKRDTRIAQLQKKAQQCSGKLDDQDTGKKARGRKLSDGGARARFYREVCDAHLSRIIKVDLQSELFTYSIDEHALTHARLMDGKLLLVTNTPDLKPEEVVKRYKSHKRPVAFMLSSMLRSASVHSCSGVERGRIACRLPHRCHGKPFISHIRAVPGLNGTTRGHNQRTPGMPFATRRTAATYAMVQFNTVYLPRYAPAQLQGWVARRTNASF